MKGEIIDCQRAAFGSYACSFIFMKDEHFTILLRAPHILTKWRNLHPRVLEGTIISDGNEEEVVFNLWKLSNIEA
jgi:hypothetical protein